MSRLTDLLSRYAHHQRPLDLRLLESIIRDEKYTGSLVQHYRNGQLKLIEAGRPIVVEVEQPDDSAVLLAPVSHGPAAQKI
jgi:hypothetical protein